LLSSSLGPSFPPPSADTTTMIPLFALSLSFHSLYSKYVLVSTPDRGGGGRVGPTKTTAKKPGILPFHSMEMEKGRRMLHRMYFLSLLFGKESPVEKKREKNLPRKGEIILPRKGKIIPHMGMGRDFPSGEWEENARNDSHWTREFLPRGRGRYSLPRGRGRIPPTGKGNIIPLRGMGRESLQRGRKREVSPGGKGRENPLIGRGE
jgi:hypothetical protein